MRGLYTPDLTLLFNFTFLFCGQSEICISEYLDNTNGHCYSESNAESRGLNFNILLLTFYENVMWKNNKSYLSLKRHS